MVYIWYRDSTFHLSAFVQASIYDTQNIIKIPKQLVKRQRVNLPVIKKQSFEWQILFVKIEGINLANLRLRFGRLLRKSKNGE